MKDEFSAKEAYVIVDTQKNSFFSGDSSYVPWIVWAFTDELAFARVYSSLGDARKDCESFSEAKFEFDGDTPLRPGRLKVMKVALVPVEQGG